MAGLVGSIEPSVAPAIGWLGATFVKQRPKSRLQNAA